MNPDSLNTPPKKWTWKTWGVYGLVMFGLIILLPVILFLSPVWDTKLMDDRHLMVVPTPVPEELNARVALEKGMASLILPEEEEVYRMLEDPEAHAAEIAGWVLHNEDFYRHWDEAVGRPYFQGEWTAPPDNWERKYQKVKNFHLVPYALALKASLSSDTSSLLTSLIHAQAQLQRWKYSDLNNFLTIRLHFAASTLKDMLSKRVTQHLGSLSSKELRHLLDSIPPPDAFSPEVLGWHIRYIYQEYILYIQHLDSEGVRDQEILPEEANWLEKRQFFYQPNRTLNYFSESFNHGLQKQLGDEIQGNFRSDDQIHAEEILSSNRLFDLGKYFNRFGKRYVRHQLNPGSYGFDSMPLADNDSIHRLQLMIAIHLYLREHGKLPAELENLHPEYLEEIPLDPWNGSAYVYRPEEKILYSVGSNKKDDGGDPEEDNVTHLLEWEEIDY